MDFIVACLILVLYCVIRATLKVLEIRWKNRRKSNHHFISNWIKKIKYKNPRLFQKAMLENLKKVQRLAIHITDNGVVDSTSHVYSSKFGGVPYFPHSMEYPRNSYGEPLALMVQFNLDEIFADLEMLKVCQNDDLLRYLPKTGMLSFFYDVLDYDLFGLDGEVEGGYKVYYFPEVIEDETNVAYAIYKELCTNNRIEDDFTPADVKVSRAITISLKYTLPTSDFNVPKSQELTDFYRIFRGSRDYEDFVANKDFDPSDTTIGGYPTFAQWDGRAEDDSRSFTLLQVNLYSFYPKEWRRSGILHYFISEEDLKNLNFSDVSTNFDCD